MNFVPVLLALGVMGILGLLFGIMLTIADKKLAVEVDPRVARVRACLGGANCGACGFAGCDAFAEAVVSGEAKPNGCTPAGAAALETIGEIMGISVEVEERKVARVICQGAYSVAKERYEYDGYRSCVAAANMAGGPKKCRFSCVGLGDCVRACAFGAIIVENGVAKIDDSKCTACGNCVSKCPRNVIELMPADNKVMVLCRNSDSGREARAACMRACIGCGRCVKECQYGAIKVENGFAKIDTPKCTLCGACAKVCPCGCILDLNLNS